MATIGNTNLTLLDHARRLDPNGKIARIAELLKESNEIMEDMIVVPSNSDTTHKTTTRTGLPTAAWRQINKGTQPTKSVTKQVEVGIGTIEMLGKIDEELINIASDANAFRLSESMPMMESITQTMASTMFYGDAELTPDRFTGLNKYYSAIASTGAGSNIIDAGGTGNTNTSVWLVHWSENTIHAIYPKNSKAGLSHEDMGKRNTTDADGGEYFAFYDKYNMRLGLVVRDWRYAVRIANVDTVSVAGKALIASNLIGHMMDAINRIPLFGGGKPCFYMNRAVKTLLDKATLDKSNISLSIKDDIVNGRPILHFMGIPIRRVDQLLNTDSTVS